eukprot:7028741-Ditylum_brightwellii.AAC.1
MHVVCNKDDDVDNGVDNGDGDSVEDVVRVDYNSFDNGDDERSKKNKHIVCDKDDDVNNGDDDGADNSDDDSVEDGDDSVDNGDYCDDKHLTHFSQTADCCLINKSKQDKQFVCKKDDDVDNGFEDGDDDSVED